jgi:single-strand DNA-binding protein
MSNPTYVKLTGWVTKDPNLRRTNGDQTPVCTIRVGAASRWPDKTTGEWREGPASYFDVVCWRGLAVNVAASVRKGHMITIHGTFRSRDWTDKENNARTSLEITASSVGHELTYGWTHYNRTTRASSQSAEQLADGEVNRVMEAGPDGDAGPGEENPFRDGFGQPETDPAADPAYEPDGERVFGTGDGAGSDDADGAELAAGDSRRAEAAVPV